MSLGAVGVGVRKRGAHLVEADAELVEHGRIRLDPHRGPSAAPYVDLPHAFHLGELLRQDRIRGVVEAGNFNGLRSEGQNHDGRIGRVHLAVDGIARQVGRQLAARRVNGGLHVARRGVNAAVEVELQDDVRRAELARRGHLRNAGDAAELALERRRHG